MNVHDSVPIMQPAGQVWLVSHSVPTPAVGEHLFICLRTIYTYYSVNYSYLLSIFFIGCCSFLNARSKCSLCINPLPLLLTSNIFPIWHLLFDFAYGNFFFNSEVLGDHFLILFN